MSELAIEVRAPGEGEPDSLAIPLPEGSSGDAFSNGTRDLDGQLHRLFGLTEAQLTARWRQRLQDLAARSTDGA